MTSVNTFLDEMSEKTREFIQLTQREFSLLGEKQLLTKPAPGRWSIAECFEHLNLTLDFYLPQMQKAIRQEKKYPRISDNFSHSFLGKLAVKAMTPKPGNTIGYKMKTFNRLEPWLINGTAKAAVTRFLKQQNLTLQVIESSQYIDLRKPKIITAVGPVLKMRLGDALHFMIAHNQRHLLQAQHVLKIIL